MPPDTPDQPRRPAPRETARADRDDDRVGSSVGRTPEPTSVHGRGPAPARGPRPGSGGERPGGSPDDPAAGPRVPRDRAAGDRSTSRPPPRKPAGPRRRGRAPLPVAALVATGWAAVVSYLPVVAVTSLARLGGGPAGTGASIRLGLAGWLLGHGVPLDSSAGTVTLVPLTLGLLAVWRLVRAGVHVSRAVGVRDRGTAGQLAAVALAVGSVYGLFGVLAAVGVRAGGPDVSPVRAGVTLALLGTLAALYGALRTSGTLASLTRRAPAGLLDGLRAGAVAALLLLGAGAATVGLAVATGGGEASDMIGAYRTGVAGQAGITLISLGYAPNAAIWSAAYLLGPGFAVGADTMVRTTEVTVGALPAVPLMAGLPHGPVDGLGALLLSVPVLAGMVAGWLAGRALPRAVGRDRPAVGWGRALVPAAIAGPVAGLLLGLAAVVSGGSLGGGRLTEIGPVGWQVAAMTTGLVAVGALIGAAAARVLPGP